MEAPYHRLAEFGPLGTADQAVVRQWASTARRLSRRDVIREEGAFIAGVYFLLEGWVASSVSLPGGKRQIVKIHLPGDILGAPSLALATAGETLEALTTGMISLIPNSAIGNAFEINPRLAKGLFLSAQRERVALMQELTWIASSPAVARLAALLLDLHDRLDDAGAVQDGRFQFPLTQQHVGELLGLSQIHVNRMFRILEEASLVERNRRHIKVLDLPELRKLVPIAPPAWGGAKAKQRLASFPS